MRPPRREGVGRWRLSVGVPRCWRWAAPVARGAGQSCQHLRHCLHYTIEQVFVSSQNGPISGQCSNLREIFKVGEYLTPARRCDIVSGVTKLNRWQANGVSRCKSGAVPQLYAFAPRGGEPENPALPVLDDLRGKGSGNRRRLADARILSPCGNRQGVFVLTLMLKARKRAPLRMRVFLFEVDSYATNVDHLLDAGLLAVAVCPGCAGGRPRAGGDPGGADLAARPAARRRQFRRDES